MDNLKRILLILIPLVLSACSGQHAIKTLDHQNQADVINYIDNSTPTVISKSKKLTFDQFITEITDSRAIFVGEIHDRYDNHINQLSVLKALHQQNPNIAIGVEWFQQPYQWVINRYLNGTINEAQLLKKSEYYQRWGYQYAMLRPVFIYAKQHKIPIIALNAPAELTRKVGKSGLASLTPQQRKQLPTVIHPPEKNYRNKLESIFKEHSKDEKMLENFITVQRIWDETMAMNTARFLKKHPKHHIIVFAGNGHISDGVGIPSDLKQQLNVKTSTISSGTKQEKSQANHVDYYVINEAISLPKSGKMGVMLKTENQHLLISAVLKDSTAEKAGIEKGDHLQSIDGKTVHNMTDFKLQLNGKRPNDTVKLQLLRKSHRPQLLSIKLILQ